MKIVKKLLATLIVTVVFTFCFGEMAFASELDKNGTLPLQGTSTEDNNITTNATDATNADNTEADVTEQNDQKFETFVDEQGQVFYIEIVEEAPAEEIVIDEIVEETVEDTKEEEPPVKVELVEAKPAYSEKDLRLLASLVYAEAGNQSYEGMLGVANVVINRMKSDVYWHVDTIEEVIYDHKWAVQFAVTIKSEETGISLLDKALKCYDTGKYTGSNPEAEKKALQRAIKAAKAALQGKNNIGNFLCFQNKRSANSIKTRYSTYKIIGDHIFYRIK